MVRGTGEGGEGNKRVDGSEGGREVLREEREGEIRLEGSVQLRREILREGWVGERRME